MKQQKSIMTIITISMLVLQLCSCTSVQPVESEQNDLIDYLDVGDLLVIYENSGRIFQMELTAINENELIGLTGNPSSSESIAISSIEKLEVEKIDGVKTTLAVAGGVIVVTAVIFVGAMLIIGMGIAGE